MNKIDSYLQNYNPKAVKEYILGEINSSGVDFEDAIMEAHGITLEERSRKNPSYIHKNWTAETMYGNMIGVFKEKYTDIMFQDQHGCWYLSLGKDIRVYLKKLDKKYNPGNVETDHVKDLWSQNAGAGFSRIHTFYIGYKIEDDKIWENIIGIYGAYPNNFYRKKMDWVVDLSGISNAGIFPISPIQSSPDGEDFDVKPKNNDKSIDL